MFEQFDVIWLTGQPGAGKTTIGTEILQEIENNQLKKAARIDGDDIRSLFENQDYTIPGRKKNIQFVQKLTDFLVGNKILPVISLVSPFKDLRDETKEKYKVLEIYVHCNEIRGREHFHVDYYEAPNEAFISIDTTGKTVSESFKILKEKLKEFNK